MTTTATTARPSAAGHALCSCRNIPEHDALCPANPDPYVCDCGDVFDPANDQAGTNATCDAPHCADCAHTCRQHSRQTTVLGCLL